VAILRSSTSKVTDMDRTQRARSGGRLGLSRRAFVKVGVSLAAAPLLARCGNSTGPGPTGNPRLSAQPGTPTGSPSLGANLLGLGGSRDGVLYVPQSYSPDTPMPLYVALHGAGGRGADWLNYYPRAEARGMILLAPDSRGVSWDLVYGSFGPDVEFLDLALTYTFTQCRVDPERVVLGGFSDGASYALSLGVCNGDLFTHLIGYSPGFYIPGSPIVGKPAVFISHGTADEVLPVTKTRNSIVPALRNAGYDVTYQEFDGTHSVPAAIGEASLDWFLGTAAGG
jgi:phospholipase/carboxylesterase